MTAPPALPLLPSRAALALARTWWRCCPLAGVVGDWRRWRLGQVAALSVLLAASGCQASAGPSPSPLPPVGCVHQHNCEEYP